MCVSVCECVYLRLQLLRQTIYFCISAAVGDFSDCTMKEGVQRTFCYFFSVLVCVYVATFTLSVMCLTFRDKNLDLALRLSFA